MHHNTALTFPIRNDDHLLDRQKESAMCVRIAFQKNQLFSILNRMNSNTLLQLQQQPTIHVRKVSKSESKRKKIFSIRSGSISMYSIAASFQRNELKRENKTT